MEFEDGQSFNFNGKNGNESKNRGKKISFEPDLLQANTVYNFRATLYENGQRTNVYAVLATMLRSPPFGGSFEVSPLIGNLDTEWTITFSNWETADGGDLEYQINIIGENG